MLLITLISSFLLSFLLTFTFYDILNKEYKEYVKGKATDIAFIMNSELDNFEYLKNNYQRERITLIDANGNVLFDNYTDISTLENHKDRPEVIGAINNTSGESKRYSDTLSKSTYNYAIKLNSGEVLRVSIITSTVLDVLISNLYLIVLIFLFILLITNIFAYRITRKIIDPLYEINFENSNVPVYPELEPYINKIFEQKKELYDKLENIKYQNNAITTITENMKEGIILLDEFNEILTYNGSICDIFEIDKKYIGENIIKIFRHNDLIYGLKHLEETGTHFVYERNEIYYQVIISPVFRNNEIKGAVILFVDITQKEQSDRFRREFSANVSHELKTPLMSILGYSELIENGLVRENDMPTFIGKIRNEAKTMSSLVEDILLISQLDENVYKNSEIKTFEKENIKELVIDVVESLRGFAKEKNIEISINCQDIYHRINKKLFSELVKNLVFNAIAYNVEDGNVNIEAFIEKEKLHLIVKDTGIGIEKKHQSRIFERFYRVEKSRDKRSGGTGLGLSIVKNVVLYHNGEIKLNSEVKKGSTFEVII